MREQCRWIYGQMGELASEPCCRISPDFDFIKVTQRGSSCIRDNHIGAADSGDNGISERWKSKWIHTESSKEPVCAMWYNGLKRITSSFGMWVCVCWVEGGLWAADKEDLGCHLVFVCPTAASSAVKPPVWRQSPPVGCAEWEQLFSQTCSMNYQDGEQESACKQAERVAAMVLTHRVRILAPAEATPSPGYH